MNCSQALEVQVGLLNWWGAQKNVKQGNGEAAGNPFVDYLMDAKLREGHTIYVSPDISRSLLELAESFEPVPLSPTDLPFSNGFVYFAEALPLDVVGDPPTTPLVGGLRALTWMQIETNAFTGLLFDTWHDVAGDVLPRPTSIGRWEWGTSWKNFRGAHNVASKRVAAYEPYKLAVRRLLHNLFAFMGQTIVEITPTRAERHTRKRLERIGWVREPLITVVELRRKERLAPNHVVVPTDRNWSHRWWVRKHWRKQFYPSKNTVQQIVIWPYVKGPSDKPLKTPRATVYTLNR